jgi:hypothetical protein
MYSGKIAVPPGGGGIRNSNSNSVDTDDFINLDYKLEDDDVDSATKMLLCTLMKSTKK